MPAPFRTQILSALIALVLFLPGAYYLAVYYRAYELLTSIEHYRPSLSTKLYDVNGELISELFEENRDYTGIDRIPDRVIRAFIAAEDRNFYSHHGFDINGILRALLTDILSGEIRQGGSTITQQLVKQVYTGSERSFRRKITELLLAREIEKRYSKAAILEMYLNQIYFGHGIYGVQTAARFFFNTDIADITAAQASVLAAIPSAPAKYSPIKNPALNYIRSRRIFLRMATEGVPISREEIEDFRNFWSSFIQEIRLLPPSLSSRSRRFDKAPYFTEYLRRLLVRQFGEKRVYNGGLRIYTTLDLRFQKPAQDIMNTALEKQNHIAGRSNAYKLGRLDYFLLKSENGSKSRAKTDIALSSRFLKNFRTESMEECEVLSMLTGNETIYRAVRGYLDRCESLTDASRVEGALIAIVPSTGEIIAMIGGSSFERINQLNRAVQARRQPGSAFKPFLYGAGIESKRITAATLFLDAPIMNNEELKKWAPSNYDERYHGNVLVRKALSMSLNTVPVLVYDRLGSRTIARFASKLMNIPMKRFALDPTLALGTTELTPLELVSGFAVYANNGMSVYPRALRRIEDAAGKIMYDEASVASKPVRRISQETAFIMTTLLREVVDHGTAYNAVRRFAGFRLPAAGKTGTNTDFRDAWFVGYTPDLAACVWIGCDSQKFTLGHGQSGSIVAAPVWAEFMNAIRPYLGKNRFTGVPPGIVVVPVCGKTGLLPGAQCPVRREYFIKGTEPVDICDGAHEEMKSIGDLVPGNNDRD